MGVSSKELFVFCVEFIPNEAIKLVGLIKFKTFLTHACQQKTL